MAPQLSCTRTLALGRSPNRRPKGTGGSSSLIVDLLTRTLSGYQVVLMTHRDLCSKVVAHCTNAYASSLLPDLANIIVPCRGQVIAVRPQVPEAFWRTAFSYNEGFEYLFQRPPSNDVKQQAPLIILGGGRSSVPAPYELGISDDSTLNVTASRYLRSFLPAVFPSLMETTQVEYEWTGVMGFTESRNPFVSPVVVSKGQRVVGQYIQAGFSGHGMSRTGGCANVLAEWIIAELDGQPFAVPERLPRHFLLPGAA